MTPREFMEKNLRHAVKLSTPGNEEVISAVRFWSYDGRHQSPRILVSTLFGSASSNSHEYKSDDYSVGLAWFNPLTDAEIVLTIPRGLMAEIRDHDGDGDNLMPFWFADVVSDIDETDLTIISSAVNCFVLTCMDALAKYNKRVADNHNTIGADVEKIDGWIRGSQTP